MRFHPSAIPLALAALLAWGAPAALADVDAEVAGKAKVKGTIAPADEIETLRFEATRGTLVSLAVAAKKGEITDLDVVLRDPEGAAVDLASFAGFADAGRKVKLRKFPVDRTGTWSIEIGADAEGEYALSLKNKPARSVKEALVAVAGGGDETVAFAVPARSSLKIKAKPSRGSAAVPRCGTLESDGEGGLALDLLEEGRYSDRGHAVTVADAGAGGELNLEVRNLGGEAGGIDVAIRVKAPREKTDRQDLRGDALGAPGGGETVVRRTVKAASGGTVSVVAPGSPLQGTRITIPPGSLPVDTRISITSVKAPPPPDAGGNQAAGPAIDLRPSGLQFLVPATVEVRYDPASLPVGADPETDLRVLLLEDDGSFTELVPISVDTEARTARVSVAGFSVCLPYVPAGSPNLEGRDYWAMIFELGMEPDQGGSDSRRRLALVETGTARFTGPAGEPEGVELSFSGRTLDILTADGGNALISRQTSSETESGAWYYSGDGRAVGIEFGEDDDGGMFVSRDGSVLLGGPLEPGFDPFVYQDLYLEKSAAPPTRAEVAGTYWWGHVGVAAEGPPDGSPVVLELFRGFGTLLLRADGTFRLTVDENFLESGRGMSKERFTANGTFSIEGSGLHAGAIVLTTGGADPLDFRLLPGANREILMGTDRADPGNEFLAAVCIRQGSGMTASQLEGDWKNVDMELELSSYLHPLQPLTVPDWLLFGVIGTNAHDGSGAFTTSITRDYSVFRDPGAFGGVRVNESGPEQDLETTSFNLASNGKISFTIREEGQTEPFVGAVSPGLQFAFLMDDPKGSVDIYGFFMNVLAPPEQEE